MSFSELRLNDNPGVILYTLGSETLSVLDMSIRKALNNPIDLNNNLIGQIEQEYVLPVPTTFTNSILSICKEYQNYFNYKTNKTPQITEVWLNMQKKHEYNPVHQHYKDIGWVIWVKIPYELEAECNHTNSIKTNKKRNSLFEFVYSKLSGEISTYQIPVDKSYEGKLLMFPGTLRHCVYPFYSSDNYRISVAGNINLV